MATLPLPVVAVSADADYAYYKDLAIHLAILQRTGQIALWHVSQALPASDIVQECNRHLDAAALILLLLSPAFQTSYECQEQLARVMRRRASDGVPILPIIMRPVDLTQSPLATIKALPRGGLAVTQWRSVDEAYIDIAQGIRALVRALVSP